MSTTPIYAALLAFLFIILSIRTLRLRRKHKIAVGAGGNPELLRAMRVHSNFAEYVPITLLLIYMFEAMSNLVSIVHGLCIVLIVGRVVHAYGVSQKTENFRFRVFGMAMTFTSMGVAALCVLVIGVSQFVA